MLALALSGWVVAGLTFARVPVAHADGDPAADVERLDKAALEAYDSLNFEQARKQLSQALDLCDSQSLGPELTAKTHLYLGMVLIAAFSEKTEARLHFQSALKLKPDLVAPKSLFNPEAQALFEEVKASAEAQSSAASDDNEDKTTVAPPPPVRRPVPVRKAGRKADDEPEVIGSGIFLSVGAGFGFGVANGTLETNQASLVSGGGSLTAEKPLHIFGEFGYALSPTMLLSAQLRLGFQSGTTQVTNDQGCTVTAPCHPPTTAFAGLAKMTWFFGPESTVVPFVSAGIGAGYIRHVVKFKLNDAGGGDCGGDGMPACVDTVKGGPV